LEVEVDRDLCIGSGNCVYGAPGTFELDDDEVAYVVDPAAASEEAIVQAARRCPSRAISVRRDGTSLV
jgi:ferredoxin